MENILITGGLGFIGSSLANALNERGYSVTILDNCSEQIHGDNYLESPLFKALHNNVKFIKGDVVNIQDWQKGLKDNSVIIHLAAETGTGQSMYEIQKYVEVNELGTANLLNILANSNHQVKKVVIASSRSIYGEGKYYCDEHKEVFPVQRDEKDMKGGFFEPRCPICSAEIKVLKTDENSKIHPNSIYGITKQNQEQLIMLACKSMDIAGVSLRFQNVYGPGQSLKNPYTGILSIFSTSILNGNDINVYEDGLESRDFVYIDDVINGIILSIEKKEANHHIFNIGSGEPTSVLKISNLLKSYYNSDCKIKVSGNFRLGDIRHNVADISKAEKLLGFKPKVNIEQGVEQFTNWVLAQELQEDNYEKSIQELKGKGFFK